MEWTYIHGVRVVGRDSHFPAKAVEAGMDGLSGRREAWMKRWALHGTGTGTIFLGRGAGRDAGVTRHEEGCDRDGWDADAERPRTELSSDLASDRVLHRLSCSIRGLIPPLIPLVLVALLLRLLLPQPSFFSSS